MAISSYQTYLMIKAQAADTYSKLIDIKDFPDLGGEPEMLDTTTLSDDATTSIPGLQSQEALSFTCNYTLTDYQAVLAVAGAPRSFSVWYGGTGTKPNITPDGHDGKFDFDGELTVYANGAGVNEVKNMTITIMPSTPISLNAA